MSSYSEMQESQHVEDYPALFSCGEDIHGMYNDCPPLLKSMFEPCPAANSDYSFQEDDFFRYSICPPYDEAVFSMNSIYEGEHHLPNHCWWNGCSDYDSSFLFGSCWDDDFSYHGNDKDGNWNAGDFERTEPAVHRSEVQGDDYSSRFESATAELSSDDHPWSGYESWFRYPTAEDSHYHGNQYQKKAVRDNLDGIELFQGIIGYWPCIMGRHQEVTYAE